MKNRRPLSQPPFIGPPASCYEPPSDGPDLAQLLQGYDLLDVLEAMRLPRVEAAELLLQQMTVGELEELASSIELPAATIPDSNQEDAA